MYDVCAGKLGVLYLEGQLTKVESSPRRRVPAKLKPKSSSDDAFCGGEI